MPKPKLYALYKGEQFLDVGTMKELAQRRGVKVSTIKFMASSKAHGRNKAGKRTLAYRIDE